MSSLRRSRLAITLVVVIALCAGALAYGHATRSVQCLPGIGTVYGPPQHGDWITSDWQFIPTTAAPEAAPCPR